MSTTEYLDQRMREFEEKISFIAACKAREMDKPYDKRDYRLLYMFHKDQAAYSFCLTEFKLLKEKIV